MIILDSDVGFLSSPLRLIEVIDPKIDMYVQVSFILLFGLLILSLSKFLKIILSSYPFGSFYRKILRM
jgi:hypothetical protein